MATNDNKRKQLKKSPGKPKRHGRRPVSGDDHPPPFGSKLWDHLETIKKMRMARKTWQAIALHLEQAHGVKVDHTTVYNFFKRASRRKGLPLGFEPTEPTSGPTYAAQSASASSGKAPQPSAEQTPTPSVTQTAIEALRAKAKQLPPPDDPGWDFSAYKDKPI